MTDEELIRRICAGETELYAQLVEKYYPGLRRYLYVMMKDYYAADDVCQEAFIKAHEKLPTYNASYKFSTWLYQIGRNRALDELRRNKSLPLYVEAVTDNSESTGTRLDKADQAAKVRIAVMGLPANYRSVVSLFYWRGMKYEEIAGIEGVPVNTVKTWLRRAKLELKELLDGKI